MVYVLRAAAYFLATAICAGALLSAWAYLESRKPGVSPEILMVIGSMSFLMLVAGVALVICIWAARRTMGKAELSLLCIVAIGGVGFLPMLGLSGF